MSADDLLEPAPTFLVVGAARSGTTALTRFLVQHPEIAITTPKEPHFFAFAGRTVDFTGPGDQDMINRRAVTSPAAYQRLVMATDGRPHRGEGSVSSLAFADNSVANIARFAPSAKIVAILRHPAERAHSSYLYLRSRGYETLQTFEDGLAAEARRTAAGWHHMWRYRALGNYATQLQPFVTTFGRDRVRIMLHDDLCLAPAKTMDSLVEFLGAAPYTFETTRHWNRGGIPDANPVNSAFVALRRSGLLNRLSRRVTSRTNANRPRRPQPTLHRPNLDIGTRATLNEYYAPQLAQLETMFDLDLERWRTRTETLEPEREP